MLTGSNLLHTKQFNLRIVHETIRVDGPLSRANVARRTALTGQTVSNLVKELIELGLVVETERRSEGRGAPSTALAINPDGAFAIGLDLNRDHLTGVLVDMTGTVRQRDDIDIDLPTPTQALDLMAEMVETLADRHGPTRERLRGVGIGVPGLMHPAGEASGRAAGSGAGYLVTPTAFQGWHDVPLASWLHDRLGLPVFLENNATAAAVGERWYGAGRQLGTFFYVFLGSGLGGGLVIDGRPHEGATGNAGEIGYLPTVIGPDAARHEEHVGVHFNLPRLYERLRADGVEVRRPADLEPLLAAGHPRLLEWIDTAAAHLTGLVLAVEYLIDPEAVVLGGRLPERVLGAFLERVAAQLPGRRIGGKATAPALLLATAGADAAALGVATLPIHEFFAPATRVLLKTNTRRAATPTAGASRLGVAG